ncbi:MAG: hypothetical protein ND895_19380, partial [Pyrinomonadaceae bacterium]|nr:hypothetical protein [Pyrinomonadaceae bacterium]
VAWVAMCLLPVRTVEDFRMRGGSIYPGADVTARLNRCYQNVTATTMLFSCRGDGDEPKMNEV